MLGILTGIQWRSETARERSDREQLLVESLVPLATQIEMAATDQAYEGLLHAYRRSFIDRGYRHQHLELRDGDGRIIASTLGPDDTIAEDDLHGWEEVRSPRLPGGRGELHVWQSAARLEADISQRWRDRWVKILAAAATIIAGAQLAIFLLISRPLGQLMHSLGKLEMGYLAAPQAERGAWEVRLLEWRLRRTAGELQQTVQRLVSAERRALQLRVSPAGCQHPGSAEDPEASAEEAVACSSDSRHSEFFIEYLEDLCRLMETSTPGHTEAIAVAEETWNRWALEAERLGQIGLKARLEDAALQLLDPEVYQTLRRKIHRLEGSRQSWFSERLERISRAVAESGVRVVALQHRVKHVAGVWHKMQLKNLELEEIADLFAIRVVVQDEVDCYTALGAVHSVFQSEPFRFKDYIERPKSNGYRSLHTSVRDDDGVVFEVQIRTVAMHREAENGAAAHWSYKAVCPVRPTPVRWFRRLLPGIRQ